MILQLRPYQSELLDRVRDRLRVGVRRILVVAPCGAGKTVMMAEMARGAVSRGRRVQLWAHRRELIEQAVTTFIEAADIHTGIVAAGYPSSPLAPVQVCSVQTLVRRATRVAPPNIIVIDEAHHQASATYTTLASIYPDAIQIGVTASPTRLDGKGLRAHFDEMIVGPSTKYLIEHGYLAPYRFFAPGLAPSLKGVHTQAGDFNRKELSHAMEGSTVVGDAVAHYRSHCLGSRALVFAWSIESSQRIAEQFSHYQIPAAHVDGETPAMERRALLQRFREGSIRVLCSVDLIGEGLDVPAVDAVFLLRPTQSVGLYIQQTGRGMRPSPGKLVTKYFDHVNNWQRHGLPDDARVWSLDGAEKRPRASEMQAKRCPQCFGVSPVSARVCRYCGVPFVIKARAVEQVAGTLQEADLDVLRALGLSASLEPRRRVCQRCGKPCEKRFCGSACYLAARRLWRKTA